jgi:ribosome-associated toxin RatA of RatAB toxin-antitoxin module
MLPHVEVGLMREGVKPMRQFSKTVSISAMPTKVWQVLADVDTWPQWTKSVTSAERVNQNVMALGAQVRIVQPKLTPAVWTVTDWQPEQSFTWISKNPGVTVTARHQIVPTSEGCQVILTIHFGGLLGGVIGLLMGRLTSEYMAMEANGLKQRAEASV